MKRNFLKSIGEKIKKIYKKMSNLIISLFIDRLILFFFKPECGINSKIQYSNIVKSVDEVVASIGNLKDVLVDFIYVVINFLSEIPISDSIFDFIIKLIHYIF